MIFNNKQLCYNNIFLLLIISLALFITNVDGIPISPYNIRVDGGIRNSISNINPVIIWNSTLYYTHFQLQVSNTPSFSSTAIDSIIQSSNNYYEALLTKTDTYYIRCRISDNGNDYSLWSDAQASDYFYLDLKFKNIIISNDTKVFIKNPIVAWNFTTANNSQKQVKYALYWKKNDSLIWTDSTGLIDTTSQISRPDFKDSGLFDIRLAIFDNYGNEHTSEKSAAVFYDTSDRIPPIIEYVHYTSLLTQSDTIFQFSSLVDDTSAAAAEYTLFSSDTIIISGIVFPQNNFFSGLLQNLNLSALSSLRLKLIFYDNNGNTTAYNNSINILTSYYDFTPPIINISPAVTEQWIIQSYYNFDITVYDSSSLKYVEVNLNGVLKYSGYSAYFRLVLTPNDTGILSLKISVADRFNNITERLLIIKKTGGNGEPVFSQEPLLLKTNISDTVYLQNGSLSIIPEKIIFYFNKKISAVSTVIFLTDEDGKNKIDFFIIDDTTIEWKVSADSLTACENYRLSISGTDYYGININENNNYLTFRILGNHLITSKVIKSNLYLNIPAGVFSEPYWIKTENISSSFSAVSTALEKDSTITVLPLNARVFIDISAYNERGNLILLNGLISLGIKYPDVDDNGMIDGSNNIRYDNLYISLLDSLTNRFRKIQQPIYYDIVKKYVIAAIDHFSIWALASNISGTGIKDSLIIFPSGRAASLSQIDKITIRFFAKSSTYIFKIFSKNGAFVNEWIETGITSGASTDIVYNLLDANNKKIKTGAYFLFCKDNLTGETIITPFIVTP